MADQFTGLIQMVLLDCAWRIDLTKANAVAAGLRVRRRPGILPQTLTRFDIDTEEVTVGELHSTKSASVTLYDNGVIGVAREFPVPAAATLTDYVGHQPAFIGNTACQIDARGICGDILKQFGTAIQEPRIRPEVEDYTVIRGRLPDGTALPAAIRQSREALAKLLSTERYDMAHELINLLTRTRFSFSKSDVLFVGWPAAVILTNSDEAPVERLQNALDLLQLLNNQILQFDVVGNVLQELTVRSEDVVEKEKVRRNELRELAWLAIHFSTLINEAKAGLELFDDEILNMLYVRMSNRFGVDERIRSLESLRAQLRDIFSEGEAKQQHRAGHRIELRIYYLILFEVMMQVVDHWPVFGPLIMRFLRRP